MVRLDPAAGAGKPCPVCSRPMQGEFAPFCSKRCADRDLGRWLDGGYRIPGEPVSATALDPDGGDGDEY